MKKEKKTNLLHAQPSFVVVVVFVLVWRSLLLSHLPLLLTGTKASCYNVSPENVAPPDLN